MTLIAVLRNGEVPLRTLAPPSMDPVQWWESTVHLWQAGLRPEAMAALLTNLAPFNGESGPAIDFRIGYAEISVDELLQPLDGWSSE